MNDTLNDAQMSLLLAAGCLPQSGALFGFRDSIFFFLSYKCEIMKCRKPHECGRMKMRTSYYLEMPMLQFSW